MAITFIGNSAPPRFLCYSRVNNAYYDSVLALGTIYQLLRGLLREKASAGAQISFAIIAIVCCLHFITPPNVCPSGELLHNFIIDLIHLVLRLCDCSSHLLVRTRRFLVAVVLPSRHVAFVERETWQG